MVQGIKLVDAFVEFVIAMAKALTRAAKAGKKGWDDPNTDSDAVLAYRIRRAIDAKKWTSVGNYALFLHYRQLHGLKRKRIRKPRAVAPPVESVEEKAA